MAKRTFKNIHAVTILAEAVGLAVFVKQPFLLRVTTLGTAVGLVAAKKSGNKKLIDVAEASDALVGLFRLTNAKHSKQFKKELITSLGVILPSLAYESYLEYHADAEFRANLLKCRDILVPQKKRAED